jgi:hypothetical protein
MADLHYIIMSQKDVIKNQILEEILRERASYYNAKQQEQDFWIITDPSLLFKEKDYSKIIKTKFYTQQLSKIRYKSETTNFSEDFLGAIISTNLKFIEWLRLRLGYFEESSNLGDNTQASYVSDGVFGVVESSFYFENLKQEKNKFYYLHPDLINEKNVIALEQYYKVSKKQKVNP